MNNYTEKDTFWFSDNDRTLNYDSINGLGESNYENADLFNTEVYTDNAHDTFEVDHTNQDNTNAESDVLNSNTDVPVSEIYVASPFEEQTTENYATSTLDDNFVQGTESFSTQNVNPFVISDSLNLLNDTKAEIAESQNDFNTLYNQNISREVEEPVGDLSNKVSEENVEEEQTMNLADEEVPSNLENFTELQTTEVEEEPSTVQDETVELQSTVDTPVQDKFVEPIVEEIPIQNGTEEPVVEETPVQNTIQMSNEDLSDLTKFEEDKIDTADIKSLFDRVGVNVKEASDIFKRNTEMKEKLDSRFEELKKLQLEVSKNKQEQYDEINSYKEEVLDKLTQKKDEIEKRLNKLKQFQASLEKEKEEFEQYRKKQKEEIERVQKEVQDAYDSRREELKHIEDVLRRQKDSLDEERSQLSLDKIQYESDKNELANNLLKFNEIVDSFTSGIDKIDKE